MNLNKTKIVKVFYQKKNKFEKNSEMFSLETAKKCILLDKN